MFFSKKLPPLWWFRILISLAFFLGGALMTIWAQGFRFDIKHFEFVSTGVLSVSSVPSDAALTYRGSPHNFTPQVLLGMSSKDSEICIEKEDFTPFCTSVSVAPKTVLELKNIHLLPQDIHPLSFGKIDSIHWDPLHRGFLQFLENDTQVQVWEDGKTRLIEAPTNEVFSSAVVSASGDIIFSELQKISPFASSPVSVSRLIPRENRFLYHSENTLFLHDSSSEESSTLFEFSSPPQNYFFFPESHSFLVELSDSIYFSPHFSVPVQKLFEKDADIHFFADGEWLFWEKEEELFGFSFGEE